MRRLAMMGLGTARRVFGTEVSAMLESASMEAVNEPMTQASPAVMKEASCPRKPFHLEFIPSREGRIEAILKAKDPAQLERVRESLFGSHIPTVDHEHNPGVDYSASCRLFINQSVLEDIVTQNISAVMSNK